MSSKPKCIIVTGQPGSGKTTLAKKLGHQLHMPVISRDEIKEGYVNTYGISHDQLPPDTNGIVSHLFFKLVNQYLVDNVSVIIEAAFQHKVWQPQLPKILECSTVSIIVCAVDSQLAAKRHIERGLDDPSREFYHGGHPVTIYKNTGIIATPNPYITPTFNLPTIHVSTDGVYTPSLSEIVKRIQATEI